VLQSILVSEELSGGNEVRELFSQINDERVEGKAGRDEIELKLHSSVVSEFGK
jgi:hypothetical protein